LLYFRWERWDERAPEIRGLETLTLALPSPQPGRSYSLPQSDVRADYTMETPAKNQGAKAVDLRGTVQVLAPLFGAARLRLDLKARMTRLDAPGVEFDEILKGEFRVRSNL
jgi:hypothetical protein